MTPLGLLQLATLAALCVLVVFTAMIIRHQTEDYFTPLSDYLLSVKIALPPAAIFIATYIVAFISGTPVGEVPKAVLSFVRNRYFQAHRLMSATCFAAALSAAGAAWVVTMITPPAYEQLVRLLLRGSSDNLQLAKERIDAFRKRNPDLAAQFGKVAEVFIERNAVNAGIKQLSGDRARTFVRALEAETEESWNRHPLRQHGLAEAYLLFGQSFEQAGAMVDGSVTPEQNPFQRAIALYQGVVNSTSPLAPEVLKMSARHNIGNGYFYMGDNKTAIATWRGVMQTDEGQNNLSSWSNMVAALIGLNDPHTAVWEGEKARAWAEKSGRAFIDTYEFAGVVSNTGFARLQLKNIPAALRDFATAHAFREDHLTRQNLALGLILVGRHGDAQKVLRQIAPPGTIGGAPMANIAACVYLIWGLALVDATFPERAVNFMFFLGEKLSADESKAIDAGRLELLRRRVAATLSRSAAPCSTLAIFETITSRILRD